MKTRIEEMIKNPQEHVMAINELFKKSYLYKNPVIFKEGSYLLYYNSPRIEKNYYESKFNPSYYLYISILYYVISLGNFFFLMFYKDLIFKDQNINNVFDTPIMQLSVYLNRLNLASLIICIILYCIKSPGITFRIIYHGISLSYLVIPYILKMTYNFYILPKIQIEYVNIGIDAVISILGFCYILILENGFILNSVVNISFNMFELYYLVPNGYFNTIIYVFSCISWAITFYMNERLGRKSFFNYNYIDQDNIDTNKMVLNNILLGIMYFDKLHLSLVYHFMIFSEFLWVGKYRLYLEERERKRKKEKEIEKVIFM